MKPRQVPIVLAIAGSDSGGGAGLQADARAIRALGCHALEAVTAVTAQDGRRVAAWSPVPPRLVSAQIAAALSGFPVAAAKTGLLPGVAAIRAVARGLRGRRKIPLVVDPVIASTSGTRFLSPGGVRVLRLELLPLATLVTPNRPEAAALTGRRIRDDAGAEAAALLLARETGASVLVKGGHARGDRCRDCLATPGGSVRWFGSRRVRTRNTHGTGCALASAIAAGLARGWAVEKAVRQARLLLWRSLVRNRRNRWGAGAGPAFF
jgi:hydroxymethylpyrimidine/phosphomethylpyrimidine kinase